MQAEPVEIRNPDGRGGFLLVCEHASNHVPAGYAGLGLDAGGLAAHIAWDPGALDLAVALSARLDAPLISAGISRLVYDCNRPPDAASAMPARSEIWEIPGNAALDADERLRRTAAIYQPFHAALAGQLAEMLARGIRPVLVTLHSFTPVWHGQRRAVEFGIIHDRDAVYAAALFGLARDTGRLRTALNEPYSAADGVTHSLALHATPHGLAHAMLEFRNDLITLPGAAAETAAWLAPLLHAARTAPGADGSAPVAAGGVAAGSTAPAAAQNGDQRDGAMTGSAREAQGMVPGGAGPGQTLAGGPNLSGQDLSGQDLSGADLLGAGHPGAGAR